MRMVAAVFALALALCVTMAAQPASVRSIATDQGCPAASIPADVAKAPVATYAVLHEGGDCVIAFFRTLTRTGTPLEVVSSRTPTHRWVHGRIPVNDDDRSPIAAIQLEGDLLLVSLSYAADDYAIPIIDSNLKRLATIHGTFVRSWPNGLLEYTPHAPDLAPRSVRIGVFGPATATDVTIYPLEPCDDPCLVESRLAVPLYFDWRTNAVAFAVERSTGNTPDQLMVTCDGLAAVASIKCRETPLEQWQAARPDLNLSQLIVFAASQPRFR